MPSRLRSLASDTLIYGVSTVAGRFLTFFLTPLYSNFLTQEQVGEVAAIYAMIAFIGVLYSMGMEPAYMFYHDKADQRRSNEVFTTAFIAVAATALLATLIIWLLAGVVASSPFLQLGDKGAGLVTMAATIPLLDALVLIPFTRLRMRREARTFALLRFVAIVVNVALNAFFVISLNMEIEGVLLAGILSSALTLVIFLPGIFRSVNIIEGGRHLRSMLRFGLPTIPSSFSSIMVLFVDRPVLLIMMGSAAVGVYQTNFRLALPMMMFVTVFDYAYKPFYLNHRDDPDAASLLARTTTLFTYVCGVIFLVTSLTMPYIVQIPFAGSTLIHPSYWYGLTIVPIVLLAYYINGLSSNISAAMYITRRTALLPVATGVAAVVSLFATWAGIQAAGMEGAAWAKVVAYACSALVLAGAMQRYWPIPYQWSRIGIISLITAIVYGLANAIPEHPVTTIIAVVVVPILYAILIPVLGLLGKSPRETLARIVGKR